MVTKQKTIDHYIEKIEAHLLRKYPHLEFRVVKDNDREAIVYYTPFSEADDYAIIHRSSGIATDALVDEGYRIFVEPA